MDEIVGDLLDYVRPRVWFSQRLGPHEILTVYVVLAAGTRIHNKSRDDAPVSPFQGPTVSSIFPAIPYLYFQGPPGSGKTEAGHLLAKLTGGKSSASITPAALFRWLNANVGKLMFLDEASGLSKRDHMEIFNAGYTTGGKIHRCNPGFIGIEAFRVFGPKIFAANTRLPISAVETRCIPVEFAVAPMEFVPLNRNRPHEKALRRSVRKWVTAHIDEIREAHERWRACTDTSVFSAPRMRQIYSPLFAIAEVAGFLEPVQDYAVAHQEQRSLRLKLSTGNRLARILEGLPEFCRAHNLPKGAIPFSSIREFVAANTDGESVSAKAIVQALTSMGYKELDSRLGGKTCYAAPSSGILAKAWDKLASVVGQKST